MSRRSFPHFDRAALRDHADEARVERVWERIEHDLSSRVAPVPGRARTSSLAYLAIAAAIGAFGAGLFLGKLTGDRRPTTEALVASPVVEKSLIEVLAAGTQLRTFPLQGGGGLTLSPGTTVEVERAGTAITLSLLQGEASIVSTGRAFTIVAGDARINTQAGSALSVRRNADDLDVKVDDGSVSVSSPAGTDSGDPRVASLAGPHQLGKNQRETVPLHVTLASAPIDAKPQRNRAMQARRPNGPRQNLAKTSSTPEWLTHYPGDGAGALALLRKQGITQAIDTAHGAAELSAIAELMSDKGGDPGAEVHAYERLVRDFPSDQRASSAAARLAKIYEARGEAARAKDYREKVEPLAKNATTGSDALFCDLIRRAPDKTKAALMAKEYLDKYPDGECREEFERLVQGDAPAPAPSSDPAPAPTASPAP